MNSEMVTAYTLVYVTASGERQSACYGECYRTRSDAEYVRSEMIALGNADETAEIAEVIADEGDLLTLVSV